MAFAERLRPLKWPARLAAVGAPVVALILAAVMSLGLLTLFFHFALSPPPPPDVVPAPPAWAAK